MSATDNSTFCGSHGSPSLPDADTPYVCTCQYFWDPIDNCSRSYFLNHGGTGAEAVGWIFLPIFILILLITLVDSYYEFKKHKKNVFLHAIGWSRINFILALFGDIGFWIWWIVNCMKADQNVVWQPVFGSLSESWWQSFHGNAGLLLLMAWGTVLTKSLKKLRMRSKLLKRNFQVHFYLLLVSMIIEFATKFIEAIFQIVDASTRAKFSALLTLITVSQVIGLLIQPVVITIDLILTRHWWVDPDGKGTRRVRRKTLILAFMGFTMINFAIVVLVSNAVLQARLVYERFLGAMVWVWLFVLCEAIATFLFLQDGLYARLQEKFSVLPKFSSTNASESTGGSSTTTGGGTQMPGSQTGDTKSSASLNTLAKDVSSDSGTYSTSATSSSVTVTSTGSGRQSGSNSSSSRDSSGSGSSTSASGGSTAGSISGSYQTESVSNDQSDTTSSSISGNGRGKRNRDSSSF